jgi:hypothetical protein
MISKNMCGGDGDDARSGTIQTGHAIDQYINSTAASTTTSNHVKHYYCLYFYYTTVQLAHLECKLMSLARLETVRHGEHLDISQCTGGETGPREDMLNYLYTTYRLVVNRSLYIRTL